MKKNKSNLTKNKKIILFVYFFLLVLSYFAYNIDFVKLYQLPSSIYSSFEEVESAKNDNLFGNFVSLDFNKNDVKTGKNGENESEVIFKLFGFIPIKKVTMKILPEEEVYAGGVPIGLTVYLDGAMVISASSVDLENMKVSQNSYLKNGDVIKKIDGQEINDINDISNVLEKVNNEKTCVEIERNGVIKSFNLPLLKDKDGKVKLGIWVKDDISGIGTLTFVRKSDYGYGALGHPVTNGKSENSLEIKDGKIYNCSLVGINKGRENDPGELKCVFVQRNDIGSIDKNTKFGIFGKLSENASIIDQNLSYKLGGRLSVRPGSAKIISAVSGIREEYDIEIIKANFQSKSSDKSMVFRVKDKRLIALTGGIVQGMSGSPIVQDGKIIGAVTHVFLNDSSKGYGIYTDFMLEQLNELE